MSRWEEERAKWLKPPESTKKGGQKIVKANIEEVRLNHRSDFIIGWHISCLVYQQERLLS